MKHTALFVILLYSFANAATIDFTGSARDRFYSYTLTATGQFYIPDDEPAGITQAILQNFTITSTRGYVLRHTENGIEQIDPGLVNAYGGLSDSVFAWDGSEINSIIRHDTGMSVTDQHGGVWTFHGDYPYVGVFSIELPDNYAFNNTIIVDLNNFPTNAGGSDNGGGNNNAIPEPSTWVMGLLGALLLVVAKKRERRIIVD